MLNITESTSAAAAKAYYTDALSRQDYYTQGQEIIGQWHGRLAERLGLVGQIDQDSFFALAENRHPETGENLTARTKKERRVGYDFTFSAPKSISLLYALTKDERLLSAFRAAVNETMRDMEGDMKTRVRKDGMEADRRTGNMAWAEFIHTTTRPVDGLPDPDLHAHCFAFNVTWDEVEQRRKAGQFGDLKRDGAYFEAAFHARLAAKIKAQGFDIERNGKWWDVAGISRELIEKYSRRSAVIKETAKRLGITDAEAKAQLGATTREHKALHLSDDELQTAWNERLSAADRNSVSEVLENAEDSANSGEYTETVSLAECLDFAKADAFARDSVVSDKQFLEKALRRGFGDVDPYELAAAMRSDEDMLIRQIDGRELVTTRHVHAEEQAMLAYARTGREQYHPLGGGQATGFRSDRLNAEQEAAVRHVLTSPDGVMIIRGGAGVGKTTLMKDAVAEIEKSNTPVFTFAPSTDARDKLREDFSGAETVARLLLDEVLQARIQGGVIWVDEAGLLGAREMNAVFHLAAKLDARVILSGDTKQHSAVPRGDAMRLLETRAGIRPAEVTEIVRQRGDYKDAVAVIEKGEIEKGLDQLDHLGWVSEVPEEARHTLLAEDYLWTVNAGKSALVVAPTHKEGEKVTALIRDQLKGAGKIGARDRTFWTLKNLSWTEAKKGDAAQYEPGLIVQFVLPAKDTRRGERFRVEGRTDQGEVRVVAADGKERILPLDQANRFQVYETRTVDLTKNDVIRVTQGGFTRDGKQLRNGMRYEIAGFTGTGDITLKNGWVIGQDFAHIAPGYCVTSHASQGSTVDRVLIAQGADSFPASSREQFYVSVSRGREQARIYTDDKRGLLQRIKESGQRASATELLEGDVTARIKPQLAAVRQAAAERVQRYRAQLQKVMAAKMPQLIQGSQIERAAYVGPVMER